MVCPLMRPPVSAHTSASRFSRCWSQARRAGAGTKLEVEFSVKVDSRAVVSVGRNASDGQFQIRLRYA